MSAFRELQARAVSQRRIRLSGIISSRLSQWRWRLLAALLLLAYIIQDAAGIRWEWLAQLQTIDLYKYISGACLLIYIGWQWHIFLARQRGVKIQGLLTLHQRSGAFAPILFYLHSAQTGYGYLAVLSWIFFANIIVGVASPLGIKIRSKTYTASWVILHVLLAALTVILAVFHAYIAFYYK